MSGCGYWSHFLRHDCGGQGCYLEQQTDWLDIINQFPRGIRPTDIDGMVEINSHFLFLEEKGQGKSLDTGQRLAFKRLSCNPNTTVLVFRPGTTADVEAMVWENGETVGFKPCTRRQFLRWIQRWAIHADAEERPAS